MQGLVNFSTAIADSIAVALPALCYLSACSCFMFAAWTLRGYAYHYHHQHRHRPWVPVISAVLCGVFATFPNFLNMVSVSTGGAAAASITSYAPSTPGVASGLLGSTPQNTVINVVTMFQYFFKAFGAACIFWAVSTWRSIVNGRSNGSLSACGIQLLFGALCMNIVKIATGVVALFQTGG